MGSQNWWDYISSRCAHHFLCKKIYISDCNCNPEGSKSGQCSSKNGQCPCKENFKGTKCDKCAEGYTLNGFPSCQKGMQVKFHVIDALHNKGLENAKVKVTIGDQMAIDDVTDHAGFITVTLSPGDNVHVEVLNDGFDDMFTEFIAHEEYPFKMIGMNPTVSLFFFQ